MKLFTGILFGSALGCGQLQPNGKKLFLIYINNSHQIMHSNVFKINVRIQQLLTQKTSVVINTALKVFQATTLEHFTLSLQPTVSNFVGDSLLSFISTPESQMEKHVSVQLPTIQIMQSLQTLTAMMFALAIQVNTVGGPMLTKFNI